MNFGFLNERDCLLFINDVVEIFLILLLFYVCLFGVVNVKKINGI